MPGGVVPPRAWAPTKPLIRPSQVLRKQKISQRRSTEMHLRKRRPRSDLAPSWLASQNCRARMPVAIGVAS